MLATTDLTHLVQANVAEETVVVDSTCQHTVSFVAKFILGTVVSESTSFHANSFAASHRGRTVEVGGAGRWHADTLDLGVTGEGLGTDARLPVTIDRTEGVDTAAFALTEGARVLALRSDTKLVAGAICVDEAGFLLGFDTFVVFANAVLGTVGVDGTFLLQTAEFLVVRFSVET